MNRQNKSLGINRLIRSEANTTIGRAFGFSPDAGVSDDDGIANEFRG